MRVSFPVFFVMSLALGCNEEGPLGGFAGKNPPGSGDPSSEDTGGSSSETEQAEELFYLHDKAWKLAEYQSGILATTQHGQEVWFWEEGLDDPEEWARDLGDVQGVEWADDLVWGTFTQSHVEGFLGQITPPNEVEVLASETSTGALMRGPGEMVALSDTLFIADYSAVRIWIFPYQGGEVGEIVAPAPPLCIETWEGSLVIGSDDGVYLMNGDDWTHLDERPAYGLAAGEGRLFGANASSGVFEVGGSALSTNGPARPGSLVVMGEWVYLADEVGGSVWRLSLAP